MSTIVGHTTRASGTVLTSGIYNADHTTHVTNATNLNADKMEGATPPVVDGHAAVFDGTGGAMLRTAGAPPLTTATVLTIANNLSDVDDAATAFTNIKQAATDSLTGVVEAALDAEIWAAVANKYIHAGHLESAAALVTLTDAATITVNWDLFINGTVTLAGNRTLGAPSNVQIGVTRTILVTTSGGVRSLAFNANYLGANDTLADLNSGADQRAVITMLGLTSTTAIITGVARY